MGALVLTKGTRKLRKQFNREFSHFLRDYRRDNILGTTNPIAAAFADPTVDLLWLTKNIRHGHSPRGDKKCLLPDDTNGHNHLVARWLYFLGNNPNVLTQANHQKIREAISVVLNDITYDRIEFDCIEVTPQDVFVFDEFDENHGDKYRIIVLGTPPMAKDPGPPELELDPQQGYIITLTPDPGAPATEPDSQI